MKGTNLGEFEELVLLTVAILNEDAYGVSIAETIEAEAERSVTISTVHNALYRLEEKGFVNSYLGGATNARGGRRKRLFRITSAGHEAISEAKKLRNKLWGQIPDLNFGSQMTWKTDHPNGQISFWNGIALTNTLKRP